MYEGAGREAERMLRGHGDRFLESLVRHDPGFARWNSSFRVTENAVEIKPGEGLWDTVGDFLGLQTFVDIEQAQLVTTGVAVCAGQRRPFALRLKMADDAVSEAELLVSTDTAGHFADVDRLLAPDVLYDAPVPPERACDRDELAAVAGGYWSALGESDGSLARIGYRCDRYDNGKKVTNTLTTLLSPDATVHTVASCLNHTRGARPTVRASHFPVLDPARGVAVSTVMVDFHPVAHSPRPDSGTFYMVAVFKVVDHEIRSIDEIREILPLGTPQAW
jgi:hypothetical protein